MKTFIKKLVINLVINLMGKMVKCTQGGWGALTLEIDGGGFLAGHPQVYLQGKSPRCVMLNQCGVALRHLPV